ncbi:hypothetical protein [Pontibacter arcticus]|uniref:Uncharacterized protein n=1 Tax=Pontibacter arcticus TaxID=2080288 RepID=A0A364RCG5_9BACT|nr:hypothetical protein [Pontibacter arcticus]RAU81945.1 hypothetical protein DP923_14790 [Pontibacter arcticus]
MEKVSESPLLLKIQEALHDLQEKQKGVQVSIIKEPIEQEDEKTGNTFLVKWLCWNIIDENGNELTEPKLEIVHKDLNEEVILFDLQKFFPEHQVIVDNEIYLEE